MAEKTVRECDYGTKEMDCRNRKGVERYYVRVAKPDSSGPDLCYYADLCPIHSGMLYKGVAEIVGLPVYNIPANESQADPTGLVAD